MPPKQTKSVNTETTIDFSRSKSRDLLPMDILSPVSANAPAIAERVVILYPHKSEDIWRKTILAGRVDVAQRILAVTNFSKISLSLVATAALHHQQELVQLLTERYLASPAPSLDPSALLNGKTFIPNRENLTSFLPQSMDR